MLIVLTGTGAASAQTVTHKREIKLPGRLVSVPQLAISDSGLGATDLDTTQAVVWKQRFIVMPNRLYAMEENGDGTAHYGSVRQSDVQSTLSAVVERHLNTNSSFPNEQSLFGMIGASNRYNLINHQGLTEVRWLTGLPTARAIVYGGANTSIVCTAASFSLNGVPTRLVSINQNTQVITSFSGDVAQQTGKSIGGVMQIAYGADDILYLLDSDNLRILKFDTGVRGGTRGAFLGTFDLNPTKPAINSMTVDLVGNFYVGSDNGGFNIYGSDGQWKQSVTGNYQTDPNSDVPALNAGYKPYLNYYASGLNDGNGTLDVRDVTGFRQYNIIAPGQTPPIKITSEPQAQAICQLSATGLAVVAEGTNLTYQWRKNGVDLTNGGTISGAATANLSITSTVAGDAGYYDVLVRKPGAIVTSQAAIITVTPTPVITMQPINQSIQPGNDATFTAAADNSPGVQWQVSTDGGATFTNISGATTETLTIPAVSASSIGNYYRAVFSALCGNAVASRAATLKLSQTITFNNPGAKNFGDPAFDLGGTASSNLPVTYTVVFGPATVSGSMLTVTNSGIVSVKASQNGNAYYTAAPDVTQTFTVMRPGSASAPFVVDTISDDVTLSACMSAPNDCSLRAAVFLANNSAAADTINFDASLANQTIVLNSQTDSFTGQLNIANNGTLTINGPGMNQLTISGNNTNRVFFIEENAVAAINNLTVTSGKGSGFDNGSGGGIYNNVNGALTLTSVTVSGSSAPRGGGIYSNVGTLALIRSTVNGNSTGGGQGGGIYKNDGTLTLTDSTVSGNSTINSIGDNGGNGGGIFAVYGATTLTNSTVSGNRALGTISGGYGGGIYTDGNSGSNTILSNSTISDNKAGAGGGVFIANFNSGTTTLTNMTVTNNLNKGGSSATNTICGGVYNGGTSTVNVSNSIIAKNGTVGGIYDVTGRFVSGGYNLIGNIYASGIHSASGFGAAGDQFGTNGTKLDPLLMPLDYYGGVTKTHALAVGSPAIDKGGAGSPPLTSSRLKNTDSKQLFVLPTTDQRGLPRPFDNPSIPNAPGGDGSDIGGFEVQAAPTAASVSVSGKVLTADGRGLINAIVTITGAGGTARSTRTSSFGYFRFAEVAAGQTCIISISSKRFTFAPQVIPVNEDVTELNFTANQF